MSSPWPGRGLEQAPPQLPDGALERARRAAHDSGLEHDPGFWWALPPATVPRPTLTTRTLTWVAMPHEDLATCVLYTRLLGGWFNDHWRSFCHRHHIRHFNPAIMTAESLTSWLSLVYGGASMPVTWMPDGGRRFSGMQCALAKFIAWLTRHSSHFKDRWTEHKVHRGVAAVGNDPRRHAVGTLDGFLLEHADLSDLVTGCFAGRRGVWDVVGWTP